MSRLTQNLELARCPHCCIDNPNLTAKLETETVDHNRENARRWKFYVCSRCGGVVTAWSRRENDTVIGVLPQPAEVDPTIPSPACEYLQQALNSLHSPAGAVMLAASAVDAMLKAKGYKQGTLNNRIDEAAKDHLITSEMAQWAHEVRLDANDPRHADEKAPLPDEGSARKTVEFAQALAQFLFVLPARVQRGLTLAKGLSAPGPSRA